MPTRRSTRDPMKYQDVFWHDAFWHESFVLRVPKTATGSQALLGGPTAHNGSHAAGLTKTLIDDMVEECGKGLAENMAKWLDDHGVTISADEYRAIFMSVFMDGLRFGDLEKITYLPA